MKPRSLHLLVIAAALLSGCASLDIGKSLERANQATASVTDGNLVLLQTNEQRDTKLKAASSLLANPLSQNDAVQLALMNSPALQALLAQNLAGQANALQLGRIANPTLAFERLRLGDELELGRLLSFGLMDLLTLPRRQTIAKREVEAAQLRLASDVVGAVAQIRAAWVMAVAAEQSSRYAQQINESAEAGADLASRMQAVGNFSKLEQAKYHLTYANSTTRLALARANVQTMREALVRLLGLTDAQAAKLKLPERLPDLPKAPIDEATIANKTLEERMDIGMAKADLASTAAAQGLANLTSLTDVELGIRRDSVTDTAAGTSQPRRGFELSIRLPIFDTGSNIRAAMSAQTLAAANRYEATVRAAGSSLRESYGVYRTQYDIAKHYQTEVVPLQKRISDENLLRYFGMFISVFDLLADSRVQAGIVMQAIDAQQAFWLADSSLQATLLGKPMSAGAPSMGGAGAAMQDAAAKH
jgi:outer membrane protein TolC